MSTISINCNRNQFERIEYSLKKMFATIKRPSGRKKHPEGARDLFIFMLRCTYGSDFTYVTLKKLEEELGAHPRTIERWLKRLIDDGWIAKGVKFVNGCMRNGFYLLKHSLLVDLLEKLKGISWTIHSDNSGEPDQKKDSPVHGEEGGNSSCPEFPDSAALGDVRGNSTRQVVGNLPDSIPIKSSNNITPPLPPQGEAADAARAREEQQYAAAEVEEVGEVGEKIIHRANVADGWSNALKILESAVLPNQFQLWIKPIEAEATNEGLRLDCEDKFFMTYTSEYFGDLIRDALQRSGINDFHFSFGVKKQTLQRKEEELGRNEARRLREEETSRLNRLSSEQQFAVLVEAYPRKSICGNYFSKRSFDRMKRRGELPDMATLLQILNKHKASDDWNRDAGRWIPGLNKWLNNRPWWNLHEQEKTISNRRSSCSVYQAP